MNLFDLAAEARALRERLIDLELDEQTVLDTLEGETGELSARATNIIAIAMELETSALAIKAAEERMEKRRKAIEARATRLRAYVRDAMIVAGTERIECPYFTAALQTNPPSVVIDNEKQIPLDCWRTPDPPPPEVDKAKIKAVLAAGGDVPGARLARTIGLRVK